MINLARFAKVPVGGPVMAVFTNIVVPIALMIIQSKMSKSKNAD